MIKRCFHLIILVILSASCKGPQVVSFVNPNVNFAEYQTYRIVDPSENPSSKDTSSVVPELEELLNSEMTGRGYKQARRSDLRLQYNFISNNRTDIDITPNYYSRTPYYYSPYRLPYNSYNIRQRNFYEAILLIELKNRSAKTVWQGSLDLRYTKKVKDKSQILPTAVTQIFESFPYEAGSDVQLATPGN